MPDHIFLSVSDIAHSAPASMGAGLICAGWVRRASSPIEPLSCVCNANNQSGASGFTGIGTGICHDGFLPP